MVIYYNKCKETATHNDIITLGKKKYLKNVKKVNPFMRNVENWPTSSKNFAIFTRQDFNSTFSHFSTLCMKKLRKEIFLRILQDKRYFEFRSQVFIGSSYFLKGFMK